MHDLSPDRALSLLDEEQSHERATDSEPFVEISVEMAQEMGIAGGEKVKVSSIRGEYIAKRWSPSAIKPLMIDGKKVYPIGLPFIKAIGNPRGRGQGREDAGEFAHPDGL